MSESTTKTAHEAPGLVLAAGLVIIALGVPAVLTVSKPVGASVRGRR
jgi:hypothetical protein